MEKLKNKLIIFVFAALMLIMPLLYLAGPIQQVSSSERRLLAKWPQLSSQAVLNGSYMAKLEEYALDHFPGRDDWRSLKAFLRLKLFRQQENNGLAVQGGSIYKRISLDEKSAVLTAAKLRRLIEQLPDSVGLYFSLIPDKSVYLDQTFDFTRLEAIMQEGLGPAEYISIKEKLRADSYYKTDLHWRQTELAGVVDRLLEKMLPDVLVKQDYTKKEYADFYGAYYGQLALPHPADSLSVLSNDRIKQSKVLLLEPKSMTFTKSLMYDPDLFFDIDPYNIYLGGPQSLVKLENDAALTDQELIIFRDSFSSSLAPLLTEYYARISLVDLRYITSESALELLNFTDQTDVLFLYGSLIMNDSTLFLVK